MGSRKLSDYFYGRREILFKMRIFVFIENMKRRVEIVLSSRLGHLTTEDLFLVEITKRKQTTEEKIMSVKVTTCPARSRRLLNTKFTPERKKKGKAKIRRDKPVETNPAQVLTSQRVFVFSFLSFLIFSLCLFIFVFFVCTAATCKPSFWVYHL